MKHIDYFFWSALMTASITLFGCGDTSSNNVPSESDTTPSGGLSMQQVQGGMSDPGDTAGQTADESGGVVADDKCQPEATDYPGDDWDTCISDAGEYQKINDSVSSIARIASFESIADLLWRKDVVPSTSDFLNARVEYTIMEGLDSRVARRYDAHLDAPEGVTCRDEGDEVLAMHPEYCVGPARIQPLIIKSLADGAEGMEPELNAARAEAALLWFLYVSTYKEAITCGKKAKDCDSSWAYYTGGQQKDGGLGISKYVRRIEQATHSRIFDGLLAIRCWRENDTEDPAVDPERHFQAATQLDRGLDRGLVVILQERLKVWSAAEGQAKATAWAFLEILGPVSDRLIRRRSVDAANEIGAAWSNGGVGVDAERLIALFDEVVPCP